MNCVADYIDKNGNKKSFYWNSNEYGNKKDCEKSMKESNIEFKEITGIWSSD